MTAGDRLAQIRAREQAATPGPWWHLGGGVVFPPDQRHRVFVEPGGDRPGYQVADAEFIAHARDDVRRMADALDSVLALHCEVGVYDVCEHTNGDECDAWETVDGEFVCGAPVDRVCDECRDECGDRLGYPCATVRAITDALGEDA